MARRLGYSPRAVLLLAAIAQLVFFAQPASATNKFPVILVHGIAGWGRSELLGFKYWGGLHGDWQERLKGDGFDVRTAEVGPLSSNWDRACELYAYIKGGTVNYGPNHAKFHNHSVTGRTFPGLYPQWGDVVNGEVQKVHLLGHSFGGNTVRMLAQLLANGTHGAPIQEDPSSHPLFAGGKDIVHSITTISAPHLGTLPTDSIPPDSILQVLAAVVALTGFSTENGIPDLFDAKLDQYGLARLQSGESFSAYLKRISNSAIFKGNTTESFLASTTVEGATEDNKWVKTLPNVFYYSFSTQCTFEVHDLQNRKIHVPRLSTFPTLLSTAYILGSRATVDTLGYPESWLANDGTVNVAAQISDGSGVVVEYDAVSQQGRWHHVALLDKVDHMAAIGVSAFVDTYVVYKAHATLLQQLPVQATATPPLQHVASRETMALIRAAVDKVST
ncbi:hypothetical protein Gpo141_00007394 [Globisporangium polare]